MAVTRRTWAYVGASAVVLSALVGLRPTPVPLRADDTLPHTCEASITLNMTFLDVSFSGVILHRSNVIASDHAIYNVMGQPLSWDGKQKWVNGGAEVFCTISYFIDTNHATHYLLSYDYVDTWGQLVSVKCDEGGGAGGGVPLEELRAADTANAGVTAYRGGLLAECDDPNSGGGGGGSGLSCYWDYGAIEISYDGGLSWETLWEGWYRVCDEEMS